MRTIRRRQLDSTKSKCQQRNRRKIHLFLKAFEYCQEYDVDIFLTIRLRHNGQIVFFNSDGGWSSSQVQLAAYCPKPTQVTWQELAARYNS
ncbi:hypothetical protein BBP40_003089 [Aspergillus hancockii]|nr:hypothetical protein BBP40_003089 [Aspergillus hancockii]